MAVVPAAYYYVDEISVVLLDEEKGEQCDCVAQETEEYSSVIYQEVPKITEDMTSKEVIEEQQVFFAFGKSKITKQGMESLDLIAKLMTENAEMKLQIFGHNNKMEDEVAERNDIFADMDNNRISAVYEYLVSKGIDASRLLIQAMGDTQPSTLITEGDDEELSMAKSRRVSFKVR